MLKRGTLAALAMVGAGVCAQVAPTSTDTAAYRGLFAAAFRGDSAEIAALAAAGGDTNVRDPHGRTPLHVAAFARQHDAMRALAKAGVDPNALDADRYDIVTIAAVAGDVPTVDVALAVGGRATNVTSRYDGTALIAAAHLGHADVVRRLIRARAARSCQQSGMDRADRVHCPGRWRPAPRRNPDGTRGGGRRPEYP